jgi:hypothetical protein
VRELRLKLCLFGSEGREARVDRLVRRSKKVRGGNDRVCLDQSVPLDELLEDRSLRECDRKPFNIPLSKVPATRQLA